MRIAVIKVSTSTEMKMSNFLLEINKWNMRDGVKVELLDDVKILKRKAKFKKIKSPTP